MKYDLDHILNSINGFEEVKYLLSLDDKESVEMLYEKAKQSRDSAIGNHVYLRGLIEYSNHCSKNCFYCGIRSGNTNTVRYQISDTEVLVAADFAWKNNYGSIVLQSGERSDSKFTNHISDLIKKIHIHTKNELRITLSCGEQSEKVFKEWYELGAKRYLLRIEASNPILYGKIHPADSKHSYIKRVESINTLLKVGYQVGTGVMIGLPFQTIDDLAKDLMFMIESGVHMVGMGPYIEHPETPLYRCCQTILPADKRVELTLKMIAVLRIMCPTINIASTTALQTLDPMGREKGLRAGANVIMPNITPVKYKMNYDLYEGKQCLEEEPIDCSSCLEKRIEMSGCKVAYGEWGDSAFYE